MKKHLKKILAVIMACAMTLSLCMTAGATEDDGVRTELPTQGSAEGGSTSEGPLPEDPIEVILPVIPETQAGELGVFDMILDPNNLINKTNGKRYAVDGVTKTFAEAPQKLYFLSGASDTEQTYDSTTRPLQIINKGRKPVNVDLTLDFTYDSNKFELVDAANKLVQGEDAPEGAAEDAAMYLGVLVGTSTTATPVLDVDPDELTEPIFRVDGSGDYVAADGLAFAFESSVTDGADKVAILTALEGLELTLSYADPVLGEDEDNPETTDIDESADTPATITVTADGLDGEYTAVAPEEGITSEITTDTDDLTVDIQRDGTKVGAITISIAKPDVKKMKSDKQQTVHFKCPVAGAVVHTAINSREDAYTYDWTDPAAVTDADVYQGITDAGYYWKQNPELTNADFPSITFKLTGNINGDELWDYVPVDETGISFAMTWDVMQRGAYNEGIAEYGDAEEISDGGTVVSGNQPTVSANKTTSTSKNLTITWTKGTGSYAAYKPDTTVTTSNGKTLTMTATDTETGGTLYLAGAYATVATNGAIGTVTFKASGKPDITVETTALR